MPATPSSSSSKGASAAPTPAASAPGRLLDMFTTAAAKAPNFDPSAWAGPSSDVPRPADMYTTARRSAR
ncbi:hypothetical protein MCEMAEM6B_02464 [Mycobacteriaceae bacterium]